MPKHEDTIAEGPEGISSSHCIMTHDVVPILSAHSSHHCLNSLTYRREQAKSVSCLGKLSWLNRFQPWRDGTQERNGCQSSQQERTRFVIPLLWDSSVVMTTNLRHRLSVCMPFIDLGAVSNSAIVCPL